MNIKITHNWLLEYLDTNATPYDIQKYLSLCGPSIESVEKISGDYVYDIEITSNRIDSASVFGIAYECQAILPMFGKKAYLKKNPLEIYTFKQLMPKNYNRTFLKIKTDSRLNPRFTAIVLSNIKIAPSPDFVTQRLTHCGIKSINNVVDVSNYLMLALGQPCHIFDYDKILDSTMIVRESKSKEKLTTLDEKVIVLPGGDIVIEDGKGRLIDLCGIMGGQNTAVSKSTKNIVLFVQTYDKTKIRRTSMLTGQRSVASTYFEKGLDPERVEPAFVLGLCLLEKYASAKTSSALYDIYPNHYKPKSIILDFSYLDKIMGIKIPVGKVANILSSLGFKNQPDSARTKLTVTVPSYRQFDINIKEDLIEEIARVYGYHNLPNNLPPPAYVPQPKETENLFDYQNKIKIFLKHLGLNETMNYSMISKEMIKNIGLKPEKHLNLSNSISEDIKYLRTELFSSLIKNIRENAGKKDHLQLFEIAKIYFPRENELPDEKLKLAVAITAGFFELKGILEALLCELHIDNFQIRKGKYHILTNKLQGELVINDKVCGVFGQLSPVYQFKNNLKKELYLAEIDFSALTDNAKIMPKYLPVKNFSVIKLDLTIISKRNFDEVKNLALKSSKDLKKVEFVSLFKNKLSLRFFFSSTSKNITEEIAKSELKKITMALM